MKKYFHWMLLATLTLGLGWSVTSCKDDDNELTPEQREKQEAEKASAFWDVVGQLVSVDDVTADYQGKTFEPTYGMPDATNATTRIVNTNDMKTAAQRFADLVNAKDINEDTPSYTWSDPNIGSMTYTRGGTSAEWATVEVNIKAVPSLQRIIYRVGGEGDNGKFEGKAYYRFGDVVSRQVSVTYDQSKNNDHRGTITEYWICVRPSFGPEGKEDSHWVCVNTVGDQNYKYYKASTDVDYWLPTNLKTNKEHMQNFAELLWAISNPVAWYQNAFEHHVDGKLWGFTGVPIFTDFTYKNLSLHNQQFWEHVQSGWEQKRVAENALNMPDLTTLIKAVKANGVHLLYKGYSWWFTTSWNCELYEAVYTNGTKDEELNMHHAVYNDLEKNMKDLKFDVRTMGQKQENYKDFFNNDNKYRWAIRHATGKELATNKKYDVKQPISGVTEVYRYYRDVVPTTDLSGKPEATEGNPPKKLDTPVVGCFIGQDGNYYNTAMAAKNMGNGAAAMVVYYNQNDRVDSKMGYHGLAIALENANAGKGLYWGKIGDSLKEDRVENKSQLQQALNGIVATEMLLNEGNHEVAEICNSLTPINKAGFSRWFLPSAGQWIKALTAMGLTWTGTAFRQETQTSSAIIGKYFSDNGCNPLDNYYWTSTESSADFAYALNARNKIDLYEMASYSKATDFKVRPFIAFDNSGQQGQDLGVDKTQAQVGYILATNGKFYKNQADLVTSGQTGAALVVVKGGTVEDGSNSYTGLAIALKPATEKYAWGGGKSTCYNQKTGCDMGQQNDLLNGLAITQYLGVQTCPDCGGSHPVFQAANTFQPTVGGTGHSQWFVPSTGQYVLMVKSFGARTEYKTELYEEHSQGETWARNNARIHYIYIDKTNFEKMRTTFLNAGATWNDDFCWTANFFAYYLHTDRGWTFAFNKTQWPEGDGYGERSDMLKINMLNTRDTKLALRPMIAF